MRRAAVVLVLSACRYHEPMIGDDTHGDAPPGSEPPMIDMVVSNCFGNGLDVQNVCLSQPPAQAIDIADTHNYDTGAHGPECDPGIAKFCVVAATTYRIEASGLVGAHGARPLVLIASSTMQIDGALDVASHFNNPMQHVGPAGDSPTCHAGTGVAMSGGGWGGSFGTKGGDGGDTGGGNGGGSAGMTLVPTTLQGGCNGSDGASNGGQRGHGGGAVYLIAASITVNGVINASGESGTGAAHNSRGGGGAGSGGMIVFDTPNLVLGDTGVVFANGGGGGEGSGGLDGVSGTDTSTPTMGGTGGAGNTTGGDGGNGAAGTSDGMPGMTGQNVPDGGGGGGGGAGVIKLFRSPTPTTGVVSPPFS
jgi:hypothetical protein